MKIQDFLEKYKKQIALQFIDSENEDLMLYLTCDLFCWLEIYQEANNAEKEKITKRILTLEKVLNQLTKILSKSEEKDFFKNLTKDLKNIDYEKP